MKKKVVRIFPCNFPEHLLKGFSYTRDLLTDEFYIENPSRSLLDLLTLIIIGDDSEYHCMDNKDGVQNVL